tara:strand:- start:1280 stop:2659 length:1380 start_codon:yes stop_codon:yes gene_type:complete
MTRVLIVDNEPSILSVLSTLLKAEGFDVMATREGKKAQDTIRAEHFDLMITDIRMQPVDGMQLLKTARMEAPTMAVIMLTAYGSVESAIEAMKLGAFDYVAKPFKVDEILITIQRALDYNKALTENMDLKAQLGARYEFDNIVAESEAMRQVCEMIERVAPTDQTVLINGESGTGKELVAKAIHMHSRRRESKFLAVNCAALPEALLESEMFGHVKGAFTGASSDKEGLFESCEGGTIMLDEIGSMPLSIQGKLLRVLQEKEVRRVGSNKNVAVNARVLAATNSHLEDDIKAGTFREDLFYRLSVIPILVRPLRERRDDILPLVYHFIREEMPDVQDLPTVEPEVCDILSRYDWPGNVRELDNCVKHALTFAKNSKITPQDLPPRIVNASVTGASAESMESFGRDGSWAPLKSFLRDKEQAYIEHVLARVDGNKERAATALKISLATLYRKLPDLNKDD